MSISYNPTHLNSNDTVLEQLLKIRKYLEQNPLYKVYLYLGEYDTNISIYDENLVHTKQGEKISEHDVILFTNDYFAVVDTVDNETSTFTIVNAYYFGADGVGTKIYVNGVFSNRQDLTDDIQNQINYLESVDNQLKESIGRNVDGIARLGTDKQDKLSQVDLDNIASINQLATAVENNTIEINKKPSGNIEHINNGEYIINARECLILKMYSSDLTIQGDYETFNRNNVRTLLVFMEPTGYALLTFIYGNGTINEATTSSVKTKKLKISGIDHTNYGIIFKED